MSQLLHNPQYRKLALLAFVLVLGIGSAFISVQAQVLPYQDPALPIEARIEDLLARMTLEEKAGQMIQAERAASTAGEVKKYYLGSLLSGGGSAPHPNTPAGWCDMIDYFQKGAMATRLQIPLIYGIDAVHGHNNAKGAIMFPHNIGLGATGDFDLIRRIGAVTAKEVRATGIPWTFAPCIAVVHNPTWGRTYESPGEETDLVTKVSVAFTQGFQGEAIADLSRNDKIAACLKHYIGDGATDYGVNAGDANFTEEWMREVLLPPYIEGIKAGAQTVMISFNTINGLECHANGHIINDILKEELKFDGFVVTDWDGINDNGGSYRDCVKSAVNAGIDMIMVPNRWLECLKNIIDLTKKGEIAPERIDDAVRRILRVKFRLGLFERPYADRSLNDSFGSAEHRTVAREAVRKSLVLLKNDKKILPLPKTGKKIFVAGKNANDIGNQCGGWTIAWQGQSGNITPGVSILEGIKNTVAPGTVVNYDVGGKGAKGHDVAIVVIGETPYAESKGDDQLLDLDVEDRYALNNVKKSGVPTIVIIVSGRPLIVTDEIKNWRAVVAAWLPGTEGQGVADVIFGDYDFSGKLPITWPSTIKSPKEKPLFPFGFGLGYGVTK